MCGAKTKMHGMCVCVWCVWEGREGRKGDQAAAGSKQSKKEGGRKGVAVAWEPPTILHPGLNKPTQPALHATMWGCAKDFPQIRRLCHARRMPAITAYTQREGWEGWKASAASGRQPNTQIRKQCTVSNGGGGGRHVSQPPKRIGGILVPSSKSSEHNNKPGINKEEQ